MKEGDTAVTTTAAQDGAEACVWQWGLWRVMREDWWRLGKPCVNTRGMATQFPAPQETRICTPGAEGGGGSEGGGEGGGGNACGR